MADKFIEWSNIYSVGIEEIDNQHKKIFNLINETYNVSQLNETEFRKLLEELNNYANFHFKLEEKLFEFTKYPGSLSHVQEHNAFRDKIKQWKESPKNTIEIEIFDFLVDWLIEHILHVDMKYAPYVKNVLSSKNVDIQKFFNEL